MNERREFRELIDPEQARETIDGLPIDPGTESVPIADAVGRVVADRYTASVDVPGFDRASMDGYAVRSSDTIGASERDPTVFKHAGTVHAGEASTDSVASGTLVEISTGAVLPPEADAVVMVERTYEVDDGIAVETAVAPGDNVMTAGTDIASGQRIIGPGRQLTARDIAALAAIGTAQIEVYCRPRVGIVSTGDELVRPGAAIDPSRGQIYDVNSHTIGAAVQQAGGDPILYPHAGDDREEMRSALETAAAETDLVITSGSTSVSAVDVVYAVVEEHGEVIHHGVAVKPGKPMLIGEFGDPRSAYIGLPGYPVSALMVFRHFVAPMLRRSAGLPPNDRATVFARMAAEDRFTEGRLRLMPVGLVTDGHGDVLAYPVDKGSGATTSLTHADGLITVEPTTAYVEAGESRSVELFGTDIEAPSLLGVGESDPVLARLLDDVRTPRFLPVGTVEGARRFERGIPDVAVVDPDAVPIESGTISYAFERTWGIVLPPDNPDSITAVEDLTGIELPFANLTDTALRDRLDALLADRGVGSDDIPGYSVGRPPPDSGVQQVRNGSAAAGLGLKASADRHGCQFISCGRQPLCLLVAPDRSSKPGVRDLRTACHDRFEEIQAAVTGYAALDPDQLAAEYDREGATSVKRSDTR